MDNRTYRGGPASSSGTWLPLSPRSYYFLVFGPAHRGSRSWPSWCSRLLVCGGSSCAVASFPTRAVDALSVRNDL